MSAKTPAAEPVLSVVIPTRERADTLAHTLASALDQADGDFEVVVSDNASQDGTADVVQSASDARLRYLNTGRRLSMCDNYEFALDHSRGRYVVIIGDDDAVIPGALDYLVARLRQQVEPAVHMWPLHVYDWPVGKQKARVSHLASQSPGRTVLLKDKARWVVRMGGWRYYQLPSPYHSAVPRSILDAIRSRTGRVFHSTQPDVFTALAIPAFADYAIDIGRSVTMNGRSARSNGMGFVARSAQSNIDRFIKEYRDYRFHPTLSEALSPRANMIPDAVLIAKDMFPELYGDVKFGYDAMLAYVARLRFASHSEILYKARHIRKRHPFSIAAFLRYSAVHEAAAVRRRILDSTSSTTELHRDVPANIYEFVRRVRDTDPLPPAAVTW